MDLIYGCNIKFGHNSNSEEYSYIVEEDLSFSTDFTHLLYLNNNQYRVVSISSDNSFEHLLSNQNIYFHVEDVITFYI